MHQRINQVAQLINDMVPPEIAAARPKPQDRDRPTPKPKPKSKPSGLVELDKSTPEGPAKTRRPPYDRLLITFDGENARQGVGEFQPGRPHRVDLSPDNPYVAQLIANRDQHLGARSLFALAITLFEQGREQYKMQKEMQFIPFGMRIADLLAIQSDDENAASA